MVVQRLLETLKNCILLTSRKPLRNSKPSFAYRRVVTLIAITSILPGTENKYYAPFIQATNIALACLEEIRVDGMRAASDMQIICQ